MRGILFDLPGVVERARSAIAGAGLGDRIDLAGGSFLQPGTIPEGADAYILRHVVHDFSDEEAATILAHVCRAAAPRGRVMVVEMVIPPGNDPFFGKWLDLMMMAYGGRERTETEYRTLFGKAGLELTRVVDTGVGVGVVEGVPLQSQIPPADW
jgi:hypothetical protein